MLLVQEIPEGPGSAELHIEDGENEVDDMVKDPKKVHYWQLARSGSDSHLHQKKPAPSWVFMLVLTDMQQHPFVL